MNRILAIDLRSGRMGFAVFETPIQLLDWGRRALRSDESCSKALSSLLRRYQVSILVLRNIAKGDRRDTPLRREVQGMVRRAARKHSIALAIVPKKTLTTFFRQHERFTKYQIASLMAAIFPEITSLLPRPRRCYEPENHRMTVFDAVALGVAFIAAGPNDVSVSDFVASAAGVFSPVLDDE